VLLAGCGSSAPVVSTTAIAPAATPAPVSQTNSSTVARTSARVAPPPTSGGPLAAVNLYWHSIDVHDFAAAYGYLAPGTVPQSEAQFASDEQNAGIHSATFRGSVVSDVGNTSTVATNSLVTDDSQFGCRTWTGSYALAYESGRWLITKAMITPAPCTGSPNSTAPQSETSAGATPQTTPAVEAPGSYSHATDADFCSTRRCIPNFPNGNGYIVQCVDGQWSHSGGLSGACSDHGGES
jgi:hypothetical protein